MIPRFHTSYETNKVDPEQKYKKRAVFLVENSRNTPLLDLLLLLMDQRSSYNR